MKLNLQQRKMMSEDNYRRLVSILTGMMSSVNETASQCLTDYDDTGRVYQRGNITIYDGYVWEAKTVAQGAFDESKWTKLSDEFTELDVDTIKGFLNLTPEQITNLQTLIDDTTITTTKTNSSSKIYMDIQAAIAECKDDTLKQIAKKVSGSYKIATSTAEVTSADYIYLISNGSNYDLYVLVEGNPTKVGDTSIDLSDYAKLTDLDNYYDKTDADGKYATITTVDGKVDKTDIVDNLTSTDTNKPLSANQGKVLKDEVDLKANDSDVVKKTDMVTTIDNLSTDTQIPSASAIYNNPKNKIKKLNSGESIIAYADTIDEMVTETVEILNIKDSPYGVNNASNDFYYTIYNINNYNFKRIVAYDIRKNDMYMIMKKNGVWGKWQKVCTTSVADSSGTATVSDSATGTVTYKVINGVCYVAVQDLANSLNGNQVCNITGLPKPSMYVNEPIECLGNRVGTIFCDYGNTTFMVHKTSTIGGYGSFSYPVE